MDTAPLRSLLQPSQINRMHDTKARTRTATLSQQPQRPGGIAEHTQVTDGPASAAGTQGRGGREATACRARGQGTQAGKSRTRAREPGHGLESRDQKGNTVIGIVMIIVGIEG